MIRTVTGDKTVTGRMLVHEHLRIDLSDTKGSQTVIGADHEADVVVDLRRAAADHGLALVVDLSVPGSGRDLTALRRISQESGVAVVAATGSYWEPIPRIAEETSVEEMAALFADEIESGVDGTDLRCGVIKIGTDRQEIGPTSAKVFSAAAQAAKRTGAAVITHTANPGQAAWHSEALLAEGLAPERILISHMHTARDIGEVIAIAGKGHFVGFDQIGFSSGPGYERIADLTRDLWQQGYGERLVISSDMARHVRLHRHGGTSYSTVFSEFLPRLEARGLGAAEITTMLETTPQTLLSLAR